MQLYQRKPELEALSLKVVVVTFESQEAAKIYADDTGLAFPMLIDQSRSLYGQYGMGAGNVFNVYGLQSLWVYLKLFAKGRRMRTPHGSYRQLGGDVLIDPHGTVRMHHIAKGPADRPSIESILNRIG